MARYRRWGKEEKNKEKRSNSSDVFLSDEEKGGGKEGSGRGKRGKG